MNRAGAAAIVAAEDPRPQCGKLNDCYWHAESLKVVSGVALGAICALIDETEPRIPYSSQVLNFE